MTTPIKTSTLFPTTRQKQSTPSAPDAVILSARPAAALAPQLIPLLDLLADLIARDLLSQRRDSNTSLEPEEGQAVTEAKALSSLTREGGTSRSHSQIATDFSSKVPPQSHHRPHVDDPVITKEKKI